MEEFTRQSREILHIPYFFSNLSQWNSEPVLKLRAVGRIEKWVWAAPPACAVYHDSLTAVLAASLSSRGPTMPVFLPDWRLPPGVDRSLWEYLHDREIADAYDAGLAGTPLVNLDLEFAERHFDRAGRLIDLGCGTGRLLLPFARRGYAVVGVDLSGEMLRVARQKAAAAGVALPLLRANLVDLGVIADQSFDYAACLFSTLGMVCGEAERRRVVAHVHRLLRPGGKFVLHVHNRWFNLWDPAGRRWVLKNLWRATSGLERAGDKTMPAHQGLAGLTLHLYTRKEAVGLLEQAGFRLLEVASFGLNKDGRLSRPWWFGGLRAYGYLIAAQRV
jgi:SAM-dependent methyltransferase